MLKSKLRFAVLAVAVLSCLRPHDAPVFARAESVSRRAVQVRWVIDGDTFETAAKERIRLIGLNAPEYQPWRNKTEPFGKESADALRKYLSKKKVYLETDRQVKDRYGRTLAYVFLEDGTLVNSQVVSRGWARARHYPPNGRYQAVLKRAQDEAKAAKRGLWAYAKIIPI